MEERVTIAIAHYGLDRKITEEECISALKEKGINNIKFIDFEAGNAKLPELYSLSFDNLALYQQRKFVKELKPTLDENPNAQIAYFGLAPIPIAFHLGYLIGNTKNIIIFQLHHNEHKWLMESNKPSTDYDFSLLPIDYPSEIQKGKGDVSIRISTSFNIDKYATYEVVPNPANEFDIELNNPHVDSLFNQDNIQLIIESFQSVLDAYANKLTDREIIHLFIASSAGLPFALGTRINPNIYPYVKTYQYSRDETPKYKEALSITKEIDNRIILTEDDRKIASKIRQDWQDQLEYKIKPFVDTISGKNSKSWLDMLSTSDDEYEKVIPLLKHPWSAVTDINNTTLKNDKIDIETFDVEDGFEYIEKSNSWLLDDGFLVSLSKRFAKNDTDILQASRLFFFHEALHYSKEGHRLTKEIASGIGQFPKVIEEADYQADVWGLLTEHKFCSIYEHAKLKESIKNFFCDAIETAIETMWSFIDSDNELNIIQIRSMNRFLNWYWQWILIENIPDKGSFKEIVTILFDKPVIEFAGAPMELRNHRTFFKLTTNRLNSHQLAAFVNNKVYRFTPNLIDDIVEGFRTLNGEKIKSGLKSFQTNII